MGRRTPTKPSGSTDSLSLEAWAPRAASLAAVCLPWYRARRRALPWRDDPTPYRTWVAELMLQQTRVETVVPYYERFLARFPSIESLAAADLESVLAAWSGLGYYRRARSLHEGARLVVREHRGEFPRDLSSALEIPGIGRYTAGAILSIAHGLPIALVDGNVERVFARIFRLDGNPKSGATARTIEALAEVALCPSAPGDFNQAIMELGATVCTPRSPRCSACPASAICDARAHGDMEAYPQIPPPRPVEKRRLECLLWIRGGRCLLVRSADSGLLRGLWALPSLEVARTVAGPPRAPSRAFVRWLERSLSLDARGAAFLARERHSITFRRFTIDAFLLREHDGLTSPKSKGIPRRGSAVGSSGGRRSTKRPSLGFRGRGLSVGSRPGGSRPGGSRSDGVCSGGDRQAGGPASSGPSPSLKWALLSQIGQSVPVSSIVLKLLRHLTEARGKEPEQGEAPV